MVTIDKVKQLRDETSISISECKKALEKTGGDIDKAKDILREWGKEVAKKKASRSTDQGLIEGYLHPTGRLGVLLDLRCETDFVAKSDDFKALAHDIAMQIASMYPDDIEELMNQNYVKDSSKKVKDVIAEYIAKLGENILIKDFSRLEI